ncbi:MAG: Inner membrane protein YgaZ [Sodalis sp.]|nr:MAG: Inner membrane protein YgaZ [Sodalis sp.]
MEYNISGLPATTALATFHQDMKDSLPIVIRYMPMVFAFGLNTEKFGLTPLKVVLKVLFIFCIIYVGASQFVITILFSAGVLLWIAVLTVMAMDVRLY